VTPTHDDIVRAHLKRMDDLHRRAEAYDAGVREAAPDGHVEPFRDICDDFLREGYHYALEFHGVHLPRVTETRPSEAPLHQQLALAKAAGDGAEMQRVGMQMIWVGLGAIMRYVAIATAVGLAFDGWAGVKIAVAAVVAVDLVTTVRDLLRGWRSR
jgi:hypothetical protein